MITVAIKYYANEGFRHAHQRAELHRLITVIYNEISGPVAICERLADEIVNPGKTVERKKGDLVQFKINDIRVIHNTTKDEDEFERQKYLDEIKLLIHDKSEQK